MDDDLGDVLYLKKAAFLLEPEVGDVFTGGSPGIEFDIVAVLSVTDCETAKADVGTLSFKSLFTDGDDKVLSNEFKIGFGNYWHHVWGMFLNRFFVFLWSLLLFVPGIIKTLSYAMTNYILVDKPELSANEAINLSKDMMYGHKFDLFYLYLSFAGWFILCLFTLGIGFLWLYPYAQAAQVSFYLDVKEDYERRTGVDI